MRKEKRGRQKRKGVEEEGREGNNAPWLKSISATVHGWCIRQQKFRLRRLIGPYRTCMPNYA